MNKENLFIHSSKHGKFLICNGEESIQKALIENGEFEPLGVRLAIEFAEHKTGKIIDVGANIGVFTIPVANHFKEKKIIAVEPQKMVFMHLCSNILLNELMNVNVLKVAVADLDETNGLIQVPIFNIFFEKYTGSVSLDNETQKIRGSINSVAEPSIWASEHEYVNVSTLDLLCGNDDISFIKIDVEGMELKVIRTGETMISSQKPFIYFESWTLSEFADMRAELLGYVISLGYKIIEIGEDCFAFHPEVIEDNIVRSKFSKLGLIV